MARSAIMALLLSVSSTMFYQEHLASGDTLSVDLANVVAGGDGLGNSLPGNETARGINPNTGQFTSGTFYNHFYYWNAPRYVTVPQSPFIDGVFITWPEPAVINRSGTEYTLQPGDAQYVTYDYIASGREIGATTSIVLGGVRYPTGIGLCSAAGITFNLEEFDAYHSVHFDRFSAIFGLQSDQHHEAHVRGYVIFSNDFGVISDFYTPLASRYIGPYSMDLKVPENARYMTLISGAGGDFITSDHSAFGNPMLTSSVPEPSCLIALAGLGTVGLLAVSFRTLRHHGLFV